MQLGSAIPEREITLKRVDLLKYCGACSDFTPTHWNERIAREVGLPDVIAHGTLTIATAVRAITDWSGDPGAVIGYQVGRFSSPVVVPDDDLGTALVVNGKLEELPGDGSGTIRLRVAVDGHEVMHGARVALRLA
jgi:acyl dehydratase